MLYFVARSHYGRILVCCKHWFGGASSSKRKASDNAWREHVVNVESFEWFVAELERTVSESNLAPLQ